MCHMIAKTPAIKSNSKFGIFEGLEGYGEVSLTHAIPSESRPVLSKSCAVQKVTTSPEGRPQSDHSTFCWFCVLDAASHVRSISSEATTNTGLLSPCLLPHRPRRAGSPPPRLQHARPGGPASYHLRVLASLAHHWERGVATRRACETGRTRRGCCSASCRACWGAAPREGRRGLWPGM